MRGPADDAEPRATVPGRIDRGGDVGVGVAVHGHQWVRGVGARAALTCSALFLVSSCGVPQVDLSTKELRGTWSGTGGASVQFQKDGTFTAGGLDGTEIKSSCPELGESARGTWAWRRDDGSTPEHGADRGWLAQVTFEGVPCDPEVDFTVYGDPDRPVVCFTTDPFSECGPADHLRREHE